ncbi:MAG: DUF4349 domain-containing protein [Oscillospiraceae bacterium]|nr:DUF4349 domain-containing protein [Oscillospiraceae bacterium]MBQ3560898.1 DUF4349 domain-containing protein [Oscillospiraceae bacterium]MBQ6699794.1 DUF4349 domain-containing protein [Oscillospiraceae bacterium]
MKKFRILAFALIFVFIFTGCGASSKELSSNFKEDIFYDYDGAFVEEWAQESVEEPGAMPVTDSVIDKSSASSAEDFNPQGRKLIRTFNLDVETLEFDDFVAAVKKEVSALGGYLESSGVSGNSYNYTSSRSADFVCRIPSDKVDEFVNTVGGLGNVTHSYEDAKDITLSYVDTEARIKSLQTEYDQLLELLAEAENIDTIILLQQRLTEVRYQLESYQSQLRTYDNLVDYSTVNLNVYEVKRVTSPEPESVWQRIGNDFGDNVYDIWVGAEDFFVWFVANIPYFIIWAIIIAVILVVLNLVFKNNPHIQERRAARKARKEYKKAQKLANKNHSDKESENPEEK